MKLDLVDVFGSGPLSGNPLAVVHGGDDLSADEMLALTRWLGFSETTFLLPPTDPAADYRVRIFYPAGELPFAGHPTLGSAHAWLGAGGLPRQPGTIVQECGVGLVEVRQDGARLAFKAPPLTKSGPLSAEERANAIALTGVDPDAVIEAVHVANGPGWQLLRLRSADDVLAAEPAAKAPAGTDIGLAGPCDAGEGADWELRAFFTDAIGRFVEDPVTGSFNAGVAMHLFGSGMAQGSYRAAQGRKTGADGLVHCRQDDAGGIWIGGTCATVAQQAGLTAFG
ncbi:PhzF family phenazine biosynthesis protein [Altererythrobacter sp. BO-6]|uniref:PhzF family phenazine biosynthesis protein n=1 Tax=Altererythrobacter sp. BO-6 TaxID=2604537 RepID=UPI0013E11F83|nr:PhzF family phenazine biosynthesis protein [Altererythrobacter sp. BO-6]QIG55174.1 PhzF family phenazine biosynthesis protein [Altererythrobacter sp. BO-6]